MNSSFFSLERMWTILVKYQYFYIDGVKNTLTLAVFAVFIGLFIGAVIAFGKMSKFSLLRFASTAYIEIFRATPLLVQVMVIYYGTSSIGLKFSDATFNQFFWGLLAVGLNSGAYMSEIIRSGINAVDGGQMEAARAVGLTQWQSMANVVLPQAIRNILPAMANEFVTMIKETSVLTLVGIHEIMFRTGDVASITYRYLEPYLLAACMYFIIVFPLSKLVAAFERRMNRSVSR